MKRFLLTVFTMVFGFVAPRAEAHNPAPYYTLHWDNYKSVPMLYAPSFPLGEWHSRAGNARGAWNGVRTSKAPFFYEAGQSTTEMLFRDCSAAKLAINQVHYADLSPEGHPLGITYTCYHADTMTEFGLQVIIDSGGGFNWYTGTGNPGAQQFDLRSVLTHEFGHGTGFLGDVSTRANEHFEGPTLCPPTPMRQTMCDGTYEGTNWTASLEAHDIHTYQAAYA